LGRTIPVKFTLRDCSGQNFPNKSVIFTYSKEGDNIAGSVEQLDVDTPEDPDSQYYRYDEADEQYIFNFSTRDESEGSYKIYAVPDDGTVHSVTVSLIDK